MTGEARISSDCECEMHLLLTKTIYFQLWGFVAVTVLSGLSEHLLLFQWLTWCHMHETQSKKIYIQMIWKATHWVWIPAGPFSVARSPHVSLGSQLKSPQRSKLKLGAGQWRLWRLLNCPPTLLALGIVFDLAVLKNRTSTHGSPGRK